MPGHRKRKGSCDDTSHRDKVVRLPCPIRQEGSLFAPWNSGTQVGNVSHTGHGDINIGSTPEYSRQVIVNWLSPLNFFGTQSDVFSRRHNGTGNWFLESRKFKSWRDGTPSTLWCPGIPGAGKTVLASITVEHLRTQFKDETGVGIACIYCNDKEVQTQTLANLLASLWMQLVPRSTSLSNGVIELYNNHIDHGTHPTLREVSTLLKSEMCRYTKVFVIVDALDECPEANGIRQSLLVELCRLTETQPNLNFLITSRALESIGTSIKDRFSRPEQLEIRAKDEDVRRYVEGRFASEPLLERHIKGRAYLRDAAVRTVADAAKGMFLLSKFHMDSLAMKISPQQFSESLERLPINLDDAYDEAMARIESQPKEHVKLAMRILSWISYAFRPLKKEELQHALAVVPKDTVLNENALPYNDLIISVCAGLVIEDQESNVMRLVHYTAQEYFKLNRENRFPGGHMNIAATCLTYLSFDIFAEGPCHTDEAKEARLKKYSLFDYSAQQWGNHVRGNLEEGIQGLALDFLEQEAKVLSAVEFILSKYDFAKYCKDIPRRFPGLWVAAHFGLAKIIGLLLDNGANISSKSGSGETALHPAARNGHKAVTHLLLNKGVDLEAQAEDGMTSLQLAALGGYLEIVQLLLDNGCDIKPKDKQHTALFWAAGHHHEAIVQLLLENGTDVDAGGRFGSTPLHILSWGSDNSISTRLRVAQLLLDYGANIDMADVDGMTALLWAVDTGKTALVELLLEEGADVTLQRNDGGTALHYAAARGNEMIVQLLLQAEADIDADGYDGTGTALHWAVGNRREVMVQLLVSEGADLEATKDNGETPLCLAASQGDKAVALMLLENGAEIMAKDGFERTALHRAASEGHETLVQLLLEKNIDVMVRDRFHRIALHDAAGNGHTAVAKLLAKHDNLNLGFRYWTAISRLHKAVKSGNKTLTLSLLDGGVETNFTDNCGRTPLLMAVLDENESLAQLLLEKGASVTVKDFDGKSALHWAAENGDVAVIQLLLKYGANVKEVNEKDGGTALHVAAKNGRRSVVQLLLENGADLKAKDNNRRTALHEAAEHKQETVVQLLLDKKADVDAKDAYGRTALHLAASVGGIPSVQLLFQSGANIEARSEKDSNALYMENWRLGAGGTPLIVAAATGHEGVVRLLLDKGADIEAKDSGGSTALHCATRIGREAVELLLLERGANIHTKAGWGWTALHWVARSGHVRVLQLLLDKGADIETKSDIGRTALNEAAMFGHEAVVRLLLERGANPDTVEGLERAQWVPRQVSDTYSELIRTAQTARRL